MYAVINTPAAAPKASIAVLRHPTMSSIIFLNISVKLIYTKQGAGSKEPAIKPI